MRNLDSSITLSQAEHKYIFTQVYMHIPAGEGVAVVDSPGHSGQVGWQRWLRSSVEYRDNTYILIC